MDTSVLSRLRGWFPQGMRPPAGVPYVRRAAFRALVIGNCQARPVADLLQAMTGGAVATPLIVSQAFVEDVAQGRHPLGPRLAAADFVFIQMMDDLAAAIRERHADCAHKLRSFPPLNFAGFHPDCVYVRGPDGRSLRGPMGEYHSSIAFWAWTQGWSIESTLRLYGADAYEALEFDQQAVAARHVLRDWGQRTQLPLDALVRRWDASGVWMHSINHPRLQPLAELTAELLRREGIDPVMEAAQAVEDRLARLPIWPVYPEIAARLGVAGSYLFKLDRAAATRSHPHLFMGLEDFVQQSFQVYGKYSPGQLHCDRLENASYARLADLKKARVASAGDGRNPYAGLPDHQFWRRAVEKVALPDVDPVIGSARFHIAPTDRVATAGSCFAQHIARTLARHGLRYFVTESGAQLPPQEREERQFGLYSARYGNIYTVRQLLQLVERASGRLQPLDSAWQRPDGRWVDPFRPQVEPAGYASEEEVVAARDVHLAGVRRLFEEMDVFVFTLGLTEAWRRREDGAVFPLAPGVVAGSFDPARHEFVNFSTAEVAGDIRAALRRLRGINPRVRFLFTVSPVPLIATSEPRHVLVSTVESKSVLRAAIGEVVAADPGVAYFPSYEIITGQHARGRYFAEDLRSVTDDGVAHVMRLFMQHYAGEGGSAAPAAAPPSATLQAYEAEQRAAASLVCDEEAIDRDFGR